jgi:hypothetical protein
MRQDLRHLTLAQPYDFKASRTSALVPLKQFLGRAQVERSPILTFRTLQNRGPAIKWSGSAPNDGSGGTSPIQGHSTHAKLLILCSCPVPG